jgi:hypothetical protein
MLARLGRRTRDARSSRSAAQRGMMGKYVTVIFGVLAGGVWHRVQNGPGGDGPAESGVLDLE